MRTFTGLSQVHAEAVQRVREKINNHIADLQNQIKEAQEALTGATQTETPTQENRLYNLLKSIESKNKVTEVTAYSQTTQPIEKLRIPTPKKHYEYIEPKIGSVIGIDKDGKEVLWEGFKKITSKDNM
jgi:hypothetical protein